MEDMAHEAQAALELIRIDSWSVATVDAPDGQAVIRYRTPLTPRRHIDQFDRVLSITWVYADEGIGAHPTREDAVAMDAFENAACGALEQDALAILTAVVTFDGARQWVFYTFDVPACGERINSLPQDDEPYPLELTTRSDPNWDYLHEEVLKSVADSLG